MKIEFDSDLSDSKISWVVCHNRINELKPTITHPIVSLYSSSAVSASSTKKYAHI